MNEEKISIHQQLMDEAYTIWEKNADLWDKDMFFDHLTYVQKVAVALGNLNYQVGNGGFSQWGFNGYAESHFGFLFRLKVDAIKYPELTQALALMASAYNHLPKAHHYTLDEDGNDDYEKVLDELDTEYYKLINLETEMEKFITELQ